MTVAELLSDESKWTRHFYARDSKGQCVNPEEPEAVSWCLVGALTKCYGREPPFTSFKYQKVRNLIKAISNHQVIAYNDSHTYEEIMEIVRKAGV